MTQPETQQFGRHKTEWAHSDLDTIQTLCDGIQGVVAEVYRSEHFTDAELDALLPVDLEAPQARAAHTIWADLKNTYYDYGNTTDPTEQLISVFAVAADTLTPNRLSTEQRSQKNARYMRAFQAGMQQRYVDLGYTTTARDWSELDTSYMINRSKSLVSGHAAGEYALAIKAADLAFTPAKRIRRTAFRLSHLVRSARI